MLLTDCPDKSDKQLNQSHFQHHKDACQGHSTSIRHSCISFLQHVSRPMSNLPQTKKVVLLPKLPPQSIVRLLIEEGKQLTISYRRSEQHRMAPASSFTAHNIMLAQDATRDQQPTSQQQTPIGGHVLMVWE